MTGATGGLRILVVGLNYAPEEIGIARYTTGMAEMLAARGHRVTVVAGKPFYPQWRVYEGHRGGGYTRESRGGVEVVRCPIYVPENPTAARRILHLASFALAALPVAVSAAFRRRADRPQIVLGVAPALLGVFSAWLAARLCGARLWVHVQDFEVEAAAATGLLDGAGLPALLAMRAENLLLRLADVLSTISPQMCDRLARKTRRDRSAIVELRNWADGDFAPDPAGAARLRREWGLEGRKVALYSGNIARKQGIEILIEVASLLRHRPDIAVVICGEGPNRARLEAQAAGLCNVRLHDLLPRQSLPALLTLADVHLLPQIPGAADLVLPSKLTNMLASRRPTIATAAPGTGLAAEVEGCGIVTEPGNAEAMAAALERLVDDERLAASLGQAAGERARERWHAASIIGGLERRLHTLAGAR